MGICNSCESTSVATAKLILQDGQLQEFSNPVKVSLVLQKMIPNNNNMFFICDSDDMDFGGFVRGLNGDEELQLGQLYFVLPLSWLNHTVRAEEMAALAVRASLALGMRGGKRCGCGGCGCKRVNHQVVFTTKKDHVRPSRMAVGGSRGRGNDGNGGGHRQTVRRGRGRGGGRRGGGGGGSFVRQLSAILEDEGRRDGGDMIHG